MLSSLRRPATHNVVSPTGLAIISYGIFLFAWMFPAPLYTSYMHEPDFMYFEPTTLLLFTLCTIAFILGAKLSAGRSNRSRGIYSIRHVGSPLAILMLPLLLFSALCSIYLVLLGGSIHFMSLLSSQQADVIKMANPSAGEWDASLNCLIGAIWWAMIRKSHVRLTAVSKRILQFAIICSTVIAMLTCIARADRTTLMALLGGQAIAYIFQRTWTDQISLSRVLRIGLIFAVVIIALFILMSFMRGASTTHRLATSIIGYTIASYNRLTAVTLNILHFQYGGTGAYLARYLSQMHNNRLLSFIPRALNLPSPLEVWMTEFVSVGASGLSSGYNWASTMGFVFSDLGWYSPFYFLGTGLFCGYFWRLFPSGNLLGIIMYPWAGFSVLFWFGWNCLFDYKCIGFLEVTLLLAAYELVCFRRSTTITRYYSELQPSPSGMSVAPA